MENSELHFDALHHLRILLDDNPDLGSKRISAIWIYKRLLNSSFPEANFEIKALLKRIEGEHGMKKLTQEEVDQICEEHEKWLKDPTQGNRADFSEKDISKLDLSRKILAEALFYKSVCIETNFEEADLQRAGFKKAHLSRANFEASDVTAANFEEAIMWHVRMGCSTVGGTNFESAILHGAGMKELKGGNASFRKAYITSAHFNGSEVSKLSFEGAIGRAYGLEPGN